MIWLTVFHGDERTFWRQMNPARIGRLYAEYAQAVAGPQRQNAPASGGSLSQYLMGGG